MKKVTMLMMSLCLGFSLGCGPKADTSQASPEAVPEDTTSELEKAAESGTMDPATYGKEGGQ